MFRPNRIGTPWIYKPNPVSGTSAWTPNNQPNTSNTIGFNVINQVPVLDFGRSQFNWTGAAVNITASNRVAIVQQISITAPQGGDTVGLELMGSLDIDVASTTQMLPIFGKIQGSIPAGQLAAGTTIGPCIIGQAPGGNTANVRSRAHVYKEQVIVNNDGADVSGVYVHGFLLQEAHTTPAAVPISFLQASYGVRQLNDQQSIGYRDTLR
jgi:hypothetical protein